MRSILKTLGGAAFGLALTLPSLPAAAQGVLAQVRARGEVICGTNPGLAGFAQADANGRLAGLDADTCRAIAAAVLGDAGKVRFFQAPTPATVDALREGRIDVAARNLTQTMTRDTELGLATAGVSFYDGQGFLVARGSQIADLRGLDGMRVCVPAGSSNEQVLADVTRRFGLSITPVPVEGFAAFRRVYAEGGCESVSTDISTLLVLRQTGTDVPADHDILPDIVSREPLGPMVKDGDSQWRSIVFWTLNALVEAEALGITAANAEAQRASPSARVRQFLGAEPGLGAPLGLADDWAFQVIRQVGNYGEVFDRAFGQASVFKLQRGLNALWNQGGLLYPIPMR